MENKNGNNVNEDKKEELPKDELRGKFLSTFKIFDDEGPTVPVEITNVGKLGYKIEDLDPKKEVSDDTSIELDIDLEDKPVNNLIIDKDYKETIENNDRETKKIETQSIDLDFKASSKDKNFNKAFNKKEEFTKTKTLENNTFSMNKGIKKDETEDVSKTHLQQHYKVSKFFSRFFSTILDQSVILALTYLYFMSIVKPSMIEMPYKYIEGVMYFIINDSSSLNSLLIAYFLITFLYYTIFNVLIKSTPFNYLLGYKIYRNDDLASIVTLIFRNLVMIPLNLLLFFPYLFVIISDDKQTIYDKIFRTRFLKEN